jgi:membrane-bound ClpP family serine protease
MSNPARRPAAPLAGALAWALLSAAPSPAPAADGLILTVPNPITSDAVNGIKAQVNARLSDPQLTHVVLDFNPDGKPAATADFGPCLDLQDYLIGVNRAGKFTVALVRANVTAHTVLPVLACRDVVMAKAATLGPVVGDGVTPLSESKKGIYLDTLKANSRDAALGAVVQKMYDADVQLRKGIDKKTQLPVFVDLRAEADRVAGRPEAVAGAPDGQYGAYSAAAAREVGLCRRVFDTGTLQEVAEEYSLPPLRPDPLRGRTPVVFRWELRKDIDGSTRESVGRVVKDVRKRGGNVLILVIRAGGTDVLAARELADELRAAQAGDDPLKVVALVPETAPAAGAVAALGCSEIVMTKPRADAGGEAKEAEIGDFAGYLNPKVTRPADADAALKSVRELAESQGYPGLLVEGMFKKDLEVVQARPAADNRANQRRLMTREEFDLANKDKFKPEWEEVKVVKPRGQLLKLSATQAVEFGLARTTVEGADARAVTAAYGWPDPLDPEPGWLDKFADFLKIPAVTVLLVVIGFTGLILELKVPGLTVPGILAALCFILVFWAHSKFSGQTFVLALLLFFLGLVLVGLEIFVLPGFGVCGVCGLLCLLAGLGLVTLDKIPETAAEWGGLGARVSVYLFAMIGALALAIVIARYLPSLPGASRLVLAGPAGAGSPADDLPGAGAAAALLGAIGTTSTPLRPAGVVKFGDQFVDVVSDGGFVPAGTRVQAIQVEGTRIVVKEV